VFIDFSEVFVDQSFEYVKLLEYFWKITEIQRILELVKDV